MKELQEDFDFAVIGGGVAGTVSAIASARLGLKTVLVQNRPVLGGPSSSECTPESTGQFVNGAPEYVNRSAVETGILEEMKREAAWRSGNGWMQHWSLVLREWCEREPLLTLYLNTEIYQVETAEQKIVSVRGCTLGSEISHLIKAPLFADCTGDSFVGWAAGAEFRFGREAKSEFGEPLAQEKADRKTMGSSIAFQAVDTGHPVKFKAPDWAYKINSDDDLPYRVHSDPRHGYWWLEYGGEINTIYDNEEIYRKLLSVLYGMWDHVKNGGDHGAERYAINWISSVPGKRESRRLVGDCILTQRNLTEHTDWPDAVAYGGWPIDIHPPEGVFGKGHPGTTPPFVFPGLYHIPFRCLYSRNIGNLMMAGRNISVTHVALGSTRVMSTCAVCGQAVGTAAAICRKYDCLPRECGRKHIRELQETLYRNDLVLPRMHWREKKNFARIEADSEMTLVMGKADGELPLVPVDRDPAVYDPCNVPPADRRRGQMFPVTGDFLESVTIRFHNRSGKTAAVRAELHESREAGVFDGPCIASADCNLVPGDHVDGTFHFRIPLACRSVYLLLDCVEDISVCTENRHLPGCYCKPDGCYFSNRNFCFSVMPEQHVFAPENVDGTAPRAGLESNIWISDPARKMPQTLTMFCKGERYCSGVEVVFDTNIDKKFSLGPAPECVRDYDIQMLVDGIWRPVVSVRDNYQRVRRHFFSPVRATAFRLQVLAVHGDASARVYNFRILEEKDMALER